MGRILALTLIYVVLSRPAQAYIDAAIGSLILQALAAGFFTFMVAWRNAMDKAKALFRKLTGRAPAEDEQQTDPAE